MINIAIFRRKQVTQSKRDKYKNLEVVDFILHLVTEWQKK